MPSELQRDAWLSDVLGFDAFNATASTMEAKPVGVRTLTTYRVPTDDVAALTAAQAAGFHVIDVSLTLERTGTEGGAAREAAPARPDEHDELLRIAGTCFRFSRFHLDPRLPRELADRVKREWVRSYVEGRRGIELLAASDDGRTAGFLAVLEGPGGTRIIDLIGVTGESQRHGIGEALVSTFVRRHGEGGRALRVGTQAANVPSLRLYEKLGFRVTSSGYVLHRHTGV